MSMFTNQQILEKAIQKAIDGGWKEIANFKDHIRQYVELLESTGTEGALMFNHDFAKALWPGTDTVYQAEIYNSPNDGDRGFDDACTLWEYHLREMVIADDPIKYLGDHLV